MLKTKSGSPENYKRCFIFFHKKKISKKIKKIKISACLKI